MKYLEITLKHEIIEGQPAYSFFSRKAKLDIKTVLDYIEKARTDDGIRGMAIIIKQSHWGWAIAENLRSSIARFRTSHKPVTAFLESGGPAAYMLACACDTILMPPSGTLELNGLHAEALFFKGALDALGVQPELTRVGEYKSAAEMFTRESMSDAYREELNALLDDLYGQLVQAIVSGRNQTAEAVCRFIDSGPYTARAAVAANLVDQLCYKDEIEEIMHTRISANVKRLSWDRYRVRPAWFLRVSHRRPKIAVIHVVGMIASGESRRLPNQQPVTGSDTVIESLRAAADNPRVRAIVLRINSPGGSALASDLIWRQIILAKSKKPVIVSFGNVAASGGYYIAAAGSKIVAEPTSVTGSIGIIGGKFVIRDLLETVGIHHDVLTRGPHGAMNSPFKPYSPSEWQKLTNRMQEFYYSDFIKKVAEGRRMPEDAVEKIARGRVWTGLRAHALGLVDELGGFERAMELAKSAANISADKKVQVVYFIPRVTWRDRIIRTMGIQEALWNPFSLLSWPATVWELYRDEDILALMPYPFRIG
ncbi:MAG: signal peptide peptidase SppA [Acidobacteria bacterium]|nr:signal peptide peptidase SppA [Acidobacteriota bacterium]